MWLQAQSVFIVLGVCWKNRAVSGHQQQLPVCKLKLWPCGLGTLFLLEEQRNLDYEHMFLFEGNESHSDTDRKEKQSSESQEQSPSVITSPKAKVSLVHDCQIMDNLSK